MRVNSETIGKKAMALWDIKMIHTMWVFGPMIK